MHHSRPLLTNWFWVAYTYSLSEETKIMMALKSLMAGAFVFLAAVAVVGTPNLSAADVISDTLAVSDTLGVIKCEPKCIININESEEPKTVTITVPAQKIPLKEPGSTANSDTLSLEKFAVSLTSDKDTPGPDKGESVTLTPVTALSDVSRRVSDILDVPGNIPEDILENEEPKTVSLTFPGLKDDIGEPQGKQASDTLSITKFKASLQSDKDQNQPEFQTETEQILVTVTSDPVPEPGTLALLATGLFGLCIVCRRKPAQQTP